MKSYGVKYCSKKKNWSPKFTDKNGKKYGSRSQADSQHKKINWWYYEWNDEQYKGQERRRAKQEIIKELNSIATEEFIDDLVRDYTSKSKFSEFCNICKRFYKQSCAMCYSEGTDIPNELYYKYVKN